MSTRITKKEYPNLIKIMKACFPDYTGRKFSLEFIKDSFEVTSYWDEGSKTYYVFVNYEGKTMEVPSHSHPFIQENENRKAILIKGLACVKHIIFCGHDLGLTIMLHPDEQPKQLTKE